MRGAWRAAAVAASVVVFLGTACTSTLTSNTSLTPTSTPALSPAPTPSPSPTVAASPAGIGGIPLAEGEVGIAYANSLTASGGPGPYTWSLESGALPTGLNLGADGSISGTPTANGTFGFTVRATDTQARYTTQAAQIKIAAHLAASLIPACASSCSVEQGCANVCGTFGQQSGGVAPFRYQASGNIPGGMKVSGFTLVGSFPSLAQYWQFTVVVTDALGATTSVTPTFYVYKHITLTGGGQCSTSYYRSGCSASGWSYSGGTPGGSPAVRVVGYAAYCSPNGFCFPTPSAPPPGFSATARAGVVSISVPANTLITTYYGVLTLVLVDQSTCGTNAKCTSNSAPLTLVMDAG